MRSSVLIALLIAVIIAGIVQLGVPRLIEHELERAISRSAEKVQYVDASVKIMPATKVLNGRIDELKLDAKQLVVNGLPIAAFLASADDMKLDMRKVLNSKFEIQSVRKMRVTVLLEEDGLNQYFWEKVDPGKLFAIRLVGGFARLVGKISILGKPIELTLNGKFAVKSETAIEYIPTDLAVAQTRVPSFLLDALLQERRFVIDLSKLPIPVAVDSIKVENSQVYVFGKERSTGAK